MASQFKVIPGLVTIRQSGGSIGVDEIQLSHDGSNALIETLSGDITLGNTTKSITLGSAALVPNAAGSLTLGDASTHFGGVYSLTVISPQDLDLTAADGVAASGYAVNITAGDADTGSDGDGGNIVLTPGALDGTGADGFVSIAGSGLLVATTLQASDLNRGSAGNATLFTDAGANNVTIGGSTSTIIVAGNLQVDGTTTTVNSAVLDVADKAITVNVGGNTAGATLSGIEIEGDSAAVVGYFRSASDNSNLEFKAPTGSILTLDMNGDATLTMSAGLTVSGTSSINQNVTTTGTPTFDTLTVNGTSENAFAQAIKVGSPTAGSYTGAAGEINAEAIYVNGTAISAGSGITTLDDLTDVVLTAETSGDVLFYDGTNWINGAKGTASGVQAWDTDLDAIAALTHTSGHVIMSNGTVWQDAFITNSNVDSAAAIAYSKLAALTTGRALQSNASTGFIEVSAVTNTELGYVSGVTSAIQTQLNNKQPLDTDLTTIAGLSNADGNFIVGNGTAWTVESGNTARTSLGLGTGNDVTFNSVTTSVVTVSTSIDRGTAGAFTLLTDVGANNITFGGSSSTVVIPGNLTVNGTTTTINSTNLEVFDKNITVNNTGSTAGATQSGINIEGDSGAVVGYFRSGSTTDVLEFKAPTGSILTLDMNVDAEIEINTPSTGQVIRFDGTKFVNAALSEVYSLEDLTDVDLTSPSSGHILYYNGSQWVNATPGVTSGVQPYDDDLADIAALTHADGRIIVSDGTDWVVESGDTARTSLGLGTGDTPQFFGLKLGGDTSSINRQYVVYNSTTDATPTELFLDGPGGGTRMLIADDSTWCFDITVVARRTDANDESARYKFSGAIDRNTGVATTSLVGDSETSITEDTTQWNVAVSADTTNGALLITVTGQVGKQIKWVAFVNTVQVTG